MYIIHSVNKNEYENEIKHGYYGKKSIGKFGFIHCSDLDTYYLVAPNFKEDLEDRLILLIDTDKVDSEIKWENGGSVDYPHIYGLLNKDAIVGVFNHLWSAERVWIPNKELTKYATCGFKRKIVNKEFDLEKWKFGIDNNELISLVLSGKKTATSSLYKSDMKLPVIGEESIICYDDGTEACIVKTLDYKIIKFNEMTEDYAKLEGEGDLSLNYWKNVHYDFFKSIDSTFNDENKIVFEIFEVVKRGE